MLIYEDHTYEEDDKDEKEIYAKNVETYVENLENDLNKEIEK